MEALIAKTVSDRVLRMYKEFNELLWIIKENCDEDEFEKYRRAFGRVMGAIALDILDEILYRQHPELRPAELKVPPRAAPDELS